MDKTIFSIKQFLYTAIEGPHADTLIFLIIFSGIILIALAAYYACKGILRLVGIAINKTPTTWDDDLIDGHFLRGVSQLAPALIVDWLLPAFFRANESDYVHWIKVCTSFYILWALVRIIIILINNLYTAISKREDTRIYAVKGIFQMLKLITFCIGIIFGISILIGKAPVAIFTALGASAAVLSLVFKDTILGLVASVQLTANKMLHKGDWIIADKHQADGEVIDVSLTTVKIRNWDKSITTIPPYALISESFRNYQPMRDGEGRRIDRSLFIDVNSVRFLNSQEIARLGNNGFINNITTDTPSHLVNLTEFRLYLERYIGSLKEVNKNMLYMVRQMPPTQSGIPLQLYLFTSSTDWKEYERFQADLFDHIYAVVGEFGLRIFQTPSGRDISALAISATNQAQDSLSNKT